MEHIILTSSRRLRAFTKAILLSALMVFSVLLGTYPILVNSSAVAPGSLPSWNPVVSCTALLTTIEGVIGNQANANGGATYGGGGFIPGIPNKRSTSPPCSINGNATFVEIHGVQMLTLYYAVEDCAQYPNGNFCDTTFNVQDPKCASSDLYICRLHVEVDQAWKPAGIAPLNPANVSITSGGSAIAILTIQASQSAPIYKYWTVILKGTSGSGTHTLFVTLAITMPPPDFSISPNRTSMTVSIGSSGTSTIT